MRQGNHEDITIKVLDKGVGPYLERNPEACSASDVLTIDLSGKHYYGSYDQMTEDRNAWSKMVATVDTLVNKTQGEKVRTRIVIYRTIC